MSPQVRAVVALIVNPAGQVLLVRSRKPGRAWELAGGGIQEGEMPQDAIRREVEEETGLRMFACYPLGELAGIPREGVTGPRSQMLFMGLADGEPKAGSDAEHARWVMAKDIFVMNETGELSPLASRVALLAWAEGARGAS